MTFLHRINRESVRSFFRTIRSFPRMAWVIVIIAFILGFLIRGGGDAIDEHTHEAETSQAQIWTCSMHPQIRLPEPGQCPICFMDLIPLETEDTGVAPTELKMSPAAMKLAEIATAEVMRGPAETTIRLSGKVTTDETRLGKITAWVPGRLERLFVDYTGITVKKGDPLVELYSPALYAAQEELLQAKKQVGNTKSELARMTARVTLEAAQEKLRQLGLSDGQIREIETRGTATDRVPIRSPMAGVVVHKNALEGLYVKQGSQIYTIADLSRVWVVLDAYEADLGWLKEGQSVVFKVEALQGERFEGQVVFVDPILNEKTRTVTVRLNADNRKGLLKPGMFVRAEVRSEKPASTDGRQPLLVPASAVLKTGKRAVVYVRKPDTEEPVFEGREIELGARAGDHYIVISGLKEGEKVVVKGNFKIDSAFQIAAKPSMMSPEGGVALTGHEHHGQSAAPSPTQQEKPERQEVKAEIKDEDIDVTVEFMNQLKSVYDAYFEAQAALAEDDFKAAQKALSELDENVTSVSDKNLKGHAAHRWHELRDALHDVARHAIHWSNIDAARHAFEGISRAMLDLERTFGHTGPETYYEVFCPMAFDNRGAPWMQNHDTVDNPYFGASMLRCGEVRETLHPKK